MTDEVRSFAPIDGHFRPESLLHFKEVAKNMAWLLERPVQKCQEDLARIYGYSGLHELQQVLKRPGIPGPFAPRYNYLVSDDEALIEGQDRRIFFILFGVPQGYWRDNALADDKCFLIFEMGLFQEAAEHRGCFEKIRQVVSYEVASNDRWPLIHGWPLGLKSLLASGYTEPFDMAEDWHKVLPLSQFGAEIARADLRWQHRMTGLVRLQTLFKICAPRIGGPKPRGMGGVDFDQFDEDGGGINDTSWEASYLTEWLTEKSSQRAGAALSLQTELIEAFVQRPSRATAAACEFVKDLKDPVGFRDRWAFESFKATLNRDNDGERALFSSHLDDGAIQSLFLHMDWSSAEISQTSGCQLWQLNCTRSVVSEPAGTGGRPTLQPVIHANGSLIVPFDDDLIAMSPSDWYICHDDSFFASEAAAVAFDTLYLPAVGAKRLDFTYRSHYSIVEIDELLLASSASVEALRAYFSQLLGAFDDDFLPDSYGFWCKTLSLGFGDESENRGRYQNGGYADNVCTPSVLLINVEGCALTFIEASHQKGKHVSVFKRDAGKKPTPRGEALAAMTMAAVRGLAVDVVVYDGEM
jgi:hypothetical protein